MKVGNALPRMKGKKNMLKNIQELFERGFEILNKEYFNGELPTAIITIQSSKKSYGHFTTYPVWESTENRMHEINISAEHLDRPIENIMSTLMHEMIHLYCSENKIEDTSKNGRYHNKNFRKTAEARGLIILYEKYIGYSKTLPSEAFINLIRQYKLDKPLELNRNDHMRMIGVPGGDNGGTDGEPGAEGKRKSSTRNWQCPCCGNKCRTTKDINIICGDCMTAFVKVSG